MNILLGAPTNDFQSSCPSNSLITEENNIFEHQLNPDQFFGSDFLCEENNSKDVCVPTTNDSSHSPSLVDVSSDRGESSKAKDTASIKYIIQMLMGEEDLGNRPFMLHDSLALQATEKSLYNALNNDLDQNPECPDDLATEKSLYDALNNDLDKSCSISGGSSDLMTGDYSTMVNDHSPNSSGVKKHRSRDDSDLTQLPMNNKQFANNTDESKTLEIYDDVLLCYNVDCQMQTCCQTMRCKPKSLQNEQSKGGPNRGRGGGRRKKEKESVVDLRSLLMQCAEAVTYFNRKALNDLLWEIRLHSSPEGDGMERVAHYFANALEARLAGTGTSLYAAFDSKVSTIEFSKAYKMFISNLPFRHASNIFSNTTIGNLASRATTLHIIDFGIKSGFQWACLIHSLYQIPGGPPKLRITGIDFPQPGLRPAERVVDACRSLAKYGERFGVPFEYNAIAQKWDTISLEDLKIEDNELLVVNSMYRLHNVQDTTETGYNARDVVLNLIRKINPDMFIHGVVNGTYNSHFFAQRFKEAIFHFSTMSDMFETLIPRDDEGRLLFEQQYCGREIMNTIACEGTERVVRPDTYKQWQWRILKAGFRQVAIDQEIVKRVKNLIKDYHKNFSVAEDGKWILLGWKGRVFQGLSCWRPNQK